jgi:hypothetical protein
MIRQFGLVTFGPFFSFFTVAMSKKIRFASLSAGLCSDSLGTFFCFAFPAAHASHGFQLPVNNQPYSHAALQAMSLSQCPSKLCAFMIGIFAPVLVTVSPVSMLRLKYIAYNAPFGVGILMSKSIQASSFNIQICSPEC